MPTNSPVELIRAFVSIPLPPALIESVREVQRSLDRAIGPDSVRWTKGDQLHLTLRFLGAISVANAGTLTFDLQRELAGFSPPSLTIEGLGCFPSARKPTIIWLGLAGELSALKQIQERVEQLCRGFGSHQEKREFTPHLTIGRVKPRATNLRHISEAVQNHPPRQIGRWHAREIELTRSELSPQGSVYTRLAVAKLSGSFA